MPGPPERVHGLVGPIHEAGNRSPVRDVSGVGPHLRCTVESLDATAVSGPYGFRPVRGPAAVANALS